jgi:hypothetical protein
MATKAEAEAARALAKPCEVVEAAVAAAPVRHADETPRPHGRRAADGANSRKGLRWLWTVATASATVFRIEAGRGASQARAVLRADGNGTVTGTIVTDRLASYAWVPAAQRQLCLAHLSRDFAALALRRGAADHIGRALAAAKGRMLALRRQRDALAHDVFAELPALERARLRATLQLALATPLAGTARNLLALLAAALEGHAVSLHPQG